MAKPLKEEIDETLEKDGFLARTIIEILGKPKEHVEHTADLTIGRARQEDKLKILSIHKGEAEKQEGDFWSTYVETELLFKNFNAIIDYCFEFMPSSVEILAPEQRMYRTRDLTTFFNEVMGKLHNVDMVAKNLAAQNNQMNLTINQLISIAIILSLRDGDKTLQELVEYSKVSDKTLKPMLDLALKAKKISYDNTTYKYHLL